LRLDQDCIRLTFGIEISDPATLEELRGYTRINGALRIRQAPQISTLEPLHCLEIVDDELSITSTMLQDLTGLERLARVGGMAIRHNTALASTMGLNALSEVSSIQLQGCPLLADVDGFLGVASAWGVWLENLPALSSLEGFANLTDVGIGALRLEHLPGLTSLEGLRSIESLGGLKLIDSDGLTSLAGSTTSSESMPVLFDFRGTTG
jgi:hypothetical protein